MSAEQYDQMLEAITNVDVDKVRELIDGGYDVRSNLAGTNITALGHAIVLYSLIKLTQRHKDIVRALLEAGADPNEKIDAFNGYLLLFISIYNIDLLSILLEYNADITKKARITDEMGRKVEMNFVEFFISLLHRLKEPTITSIIDLLKDRPGFDVNTQSGYIRTTLLIYAARINNIDIVRKLLEIGADPSIVDDRGKTAAQYAVLPEIVKLLETPWKGFSSEDIANLNSIFETDSPNAQGRTAADNLSFCPICAKFVLRTEGCMYMKGGVGEAHDCKKSPYYHPELYSKYSKQDKIEWCTICGRICSGEHTHYPLTRINEPLPAPIPPKQTEGNMGPFGGPSSCINKYGGGGLDEKLARFRVFRKKAAELQSQIGKITTSEAYRQLIEACWNPFEQSTPPVVNPFNLPNDQFYIPYNPFNLPNNNNPPVATVNAGLAANKAAKRFLNSYNGVFPSESNLRKKNAAPADEPEAPDIVKPSEEKTRVIEAPPEDAMNFMLNSPGEGNRWLEIPYVGGYTEQLTENSLKLLIGEYVLNFGTEKFGRAAAFPEHQELLYPSDIQGYVDEELYNDYRRKFNKRFRAAGGAGAAQGGGGRRTRKRKGARKNRTVRRKRTRRLRTTKRS